MNCPKCNSYSIIRQAQSLTEEGDKLVVDFVCKCNNCGAVFETFADYSLNKEILKYIDI